MSIVIVKNIEEKINTRMAKIKYPPNAIKKRPNMVVHPEYTLLKELKTYKYPVDGWTWYDERPADPR
jgi:hypothetical protein